MKKNIIVPVDFSTASHNAYLYARDMARVLGANIKLVHIVPSYANTDSRAKAVKNLNDFSGLFPEEQDLEVMTELDIRLEVLEGGIVDSIVHLSGDADMVIMGKTGEQKIIERIVGTVSSAVAQQAKCPVILVPKGARFFMVEQILYASNYTSTDENMVKALMDFANIFRAQVHFIHVNEPDDPENTALTEEKIFEELFKKGEPAFAFSMASVDHDTIWEGLDKYALEKNIDLIVLVNHTRGTIESMVGASTTKSMALKSNRPLMIYHLENKAG